VKVLVADDDRLSRTVLADTVAKMGHAVVLAADGREALERLEDPGAGVRLAMLDWTMPHLDGPEVCARVRARVGAGYVYLVLVSARSKEEHVIAGLEAGADDYIVKPISPLAVRARIRAGERVLEYQSTLATYQAYLDEVVANLDCGVMLSHPSGRVLFANDALSRLAGVPEGRVGALRDEVLALHGRHVPDARRFLQRMLAPTSVPVMIDVELSLSDTPRVLSWSSKEVKLPEGPARLDICRDITAETQLSRVLAEKASQDHLTGLLNRRGGEEALAREASRSARRHTPVSLVMVDIDHFKRVNDEHGHAAGDRVLRATAQLVKKQLRPYDHVIRWGGEEILVVLPDTSGFQGVMIAERLRTAIAANRIDGGPSVTVSLGVAELIHDGGTPEVALAAADAALYRAKASGRNCVKRAGDERDTLPPPGVHAHSNPPP